MFSVFFFFPFSDVKEFLMTVGFSISAQDSGNNNLDVITHICGSTRKHGRVFRIVWV